MDNNELMEMMKKAQKMIDNNEVPEEIKMMAKNMSNNNNSSNNIDMNKLMKMLGNVNFNSDDDLTRLLFALKPYLRNERKEKVDEYVKLIKLGKMAELFEKLNSNK